MASEQEMFTLTSIQLKFVTAAAVDHIIIKNNIIETQIIED